MEEGMAEDSDNDKGASRFKDDGEEELSAEEAITTTEGE